MLYEIRLMTVPEHHVVMASVRKAEIGTAIPRIMEHDIKIKSVREGFLVGEAFGYWTSLQVEDFNSYQYLVREGEHADDVIARLASGTTEFEEVGRDVYNVESEFKGKQYRGYFKYEVIMSYEIRLTAMPEYQIVMASARVVETNNTQRKIENDIKIDSYANRHLIGRAFGYKTSIFVADFNSYQDLVREGKQADDVMARLASGTTEFEEVGRDIYAVEAEFKGKQYRGFLDYGK